MQAFSPPSRIGQSIALATALGVNLLVLVVLLLPSSQEAKRQASPKTFAPVSALLRLKPPTLRPTPRLPPAQAREKPSITPAPRLEAVAGTSNPSNEPIAELEPRERPSQAPAAAQAQPSSAPETPRQTLDLSSDTLRRAARAAQAHSVGGLAAAAQEALPQASGPASALSESVQRAQRPDCRNAYSSSGLLALPALAAAAVSDQGCRW